MKITRTILLVAAIAAVCTLAMSKTLAGPSVATSPAAGAVKVAVCDVRRIWGTSRYLVELHAASSVKIQERQQALMKLTESKLADIRTTREMLAEYKTGQDYEDHLAEARKKEIAFRLWQEVEKASLEHQAFMMKKSSYEKVLAAVSDVAERMGIDVVLYSRSGPASSYGVNNVKDLTAWITSQSVMYSSPRADITDEVIKTLDAAGE